MFMLLFLHTMKAHCYQELPKKHHKSGPYFPHLPVPLNGFAYCYSMKIFPSATAIKSHLICQNKSLSNQAAVGQCGDSCDQLENEQNLHGELFHPCAKRADSCWNDWNSPTKFRRAMLNVGAHLV